MTKLEKEVYLVAERLNRSIEVTGKQIIVGHRNGHIAIDISNLDGSGFNNLDAGLSNRQALNNLYNMCKTAELFTNVLNKK